MIVMNWCALKVRSYYCISTVRSTHDMAIPLKSQVCTLDSFTNDTPKLQFNSKFFKTLSNLDKSNPIPGPLSL